MVSVAVTAALLALLATDCCIAATLGEKSNGKMFKIPVKRRESASERKMKNLEGMTIEDVIIDNYQPSYSKYHPEPLTNYDNKIYYGEIEIGTPPKKFTVDFITSDVDFWLPSIKVKPQDFCSDRHCFNCSASKSCQPTGEDYGSLGVYIGFGVLDVDTIKIGDLELKNQTFVELKLIFDEGFPVKDFKSDGVLGLGLNHVGYTPPLFHAINDKLLDKKAFSFYLDKNHPEGSYLALGGWDEEVIEADKINWVPITSLDSWSIPMDSIKVGTNLTVGVGREPIIDTGTSLITGPPEDIKAIAHTLGFTYSKKIGLYVIDASKVGDLPDIVININEVGYVLKPKDYTISGNQNDNLVALGFNEGHLIWILGDVFLSTVYSIYSIDDCAVGLAPLKKKSQTY